MLFKQLYDALGAEALDEARHFRPPAKRFTASGAADCVWKLWYELSGYRPAPATATQKLYRIQGEADQDLLRQMLRHYKIDLGGVRWDDHKAVETLHGDKSFRVELGDGFVTYVRITTRADGAIDDGTLFEFKSTSGQAFYWMEKAFAEGTILSYLREKRTGHYWQVQCMMAVLGYGRTLLGYKDRSSAQYGFRGPDGGRHGVMVEFDPRLFQEILQRLAAIQRCVEAGTEPPRSLRESPKSSPCGYCAFRYLCHDADARRDAGKEPAVVYPGPLMEVQI